MSALVDIRQQTQGRWADILTIIGIAPEFLRNRHGECPICSGHDRFRFDNKDGHGSYYCNGCGPGDGTSLVMKYLGVPFKEAASEVRKIIGICKVEAQKTIIEDYSKNEITTAAIHAGLKVMRGDCIGSKYLLGRGLTVLPAKDCYFHSSLGYYDGVKLVGNYPALVSYFRNVDGARVLSHHTYLSPEGGKASVESPKKSRLKVVENTQGASIQLFPASEIMAVAEGIETALAVNMSEGLPVWAAGDAGRLAAMRLPDLVKEVWIYADYDASFTGQKCAYTLASRLKNEGKIVRVVVLIDGQNYTDKGTGGDFLDAWLVDQSQKQSATSVPKSPIS